MNRPLIVDSFAGGGGASEGIRTALGRDPDIAINHDRLALAMHRINHPDTHHLFEDVWHVDPVGTCANRPIGLFWMSPDCKHFSKAKGGKPREKAIRGLAWVGLRWVQGLPRWQRPRVVILENVEEFQDWGPLLEDGKPCPLQRGATFRRFIGAFEDSGYVVEWRELRACDYGAPTIRKRLFLIARRDGKPIAWPDPTHGDPKSEGVRSGLLRPWRTAAEIIDWSLPCPLIFETSAEIKARLGIRANRPLADATMARIAKGTKRYVIDAAKPFLVRVNHGDSRGRRDRGLDEPMPTTTHHGGDALVSPVVVQVNHGGTAGGRDHPTDEPMPTITGKRGEALITAFVSYAQQGGANRDVEAPLHTITASPKDHNTVIAPFVTKFNRGATGHPIDEPLHTVTSHASETHGGGAAPLGIVAPVIVNVANGQTTGRGPNVWPVDDPLRTVTQAGTHAVVSPILVGCGGRAGQSEPRSADAPMGTQTSKADLCVVAPFLAPRYQEKPGHEPRVRSVEEPTATIIGGDNVPGHLVSSFLVPRYGERLGQEPRSRSIEEPFPVVVPTGNEGSLAAVHLSRQFGASIGSAADEPVGTITAGGAGKAAIVAAFLAQHNTEANGQPKAGSDVREPVRTVTATGGQQTLVAAHLTHVYTSNTRGGQGDPRHPLKTVMAGGNHAAAVYAFLQKYYGTGAIAQTPDEPLHTLTSKPRHGVVTVTIQGESYAIIDIGMRMLTPRERFNAQGFRSDYVIDRGELEDGTFVPLTLEQQGRCCGNSVCPDMARVLVLANYREEDELPRREAEPMPLFAAE